MLVITIPAGEQWDEANQCFINTEEQTLELEHSLVSLSAWESKWKKPFLSKNGMTAEETLDYIKCMTITKGVNPEVYNFLTSENISQIRDYIEDTMTATWFKEDGTKGSNREQVTAELIYYWMIALNIPSEYQYWHLNRLLTLIRICNVKNQPAKKMSKRDIMSQNAALNAARRKSHNTRG